jgi:predicted ATPase/class 3 adenylate cyclase
LSDAQQQCSLAFVFTDIEGSSRLWEAHGGTFLKALETHDALLTETCREFGGQVVKNEGDAFFLVFDEPRQALQFALHAQQLLQEYDWQQHLPDALRVRMGLHYGGMFERNGDYFGTEVNRTARLCDAGHGGQILASEELLAACGEIPPHTVVTDLARHRLRGLTVPQHLYQVTLAHWERQEWPVLRTLDDVPTNLPAQVTSFVGREKDLERVASLLVDPQVRLLTLTGPGGSGKSRLAQEAAAHALERFPDGVFWVSLAELSTVEAVPAAIMEVLKLQPQVGKSPAAVIAAHAHDRQFLLVLDNFEHLIEAADFLADLLRLSADVRLLVTSREVLHLQGEQLFHVLPLALPEPPINYQTLSQYESVHLFLHRARAVSEDFAITEENAAAIAEICLRLDGIPLAIELAAAWVRVYPPLRILQRLGGSSRLLTSRVRGIAERQRTVADTIDWSYRMLSPEEQRTLRWLSVFRGGFFLDAAEGICGPEAVENVMTLYDKSLLYSKEALSQQRFHMLETIREFAEEKLEAAGEAEEAQRNHLAYYAEWTKGLRKHGEEQQDERFWSLIVAEAHNAQQALAEALRTQSLAGTEALLGIVDARHGMAGAGDRMLPLLEEVLTHVPGHEGELWTAEAASMRLRCYFSCQRHREGLEHAEEAFALCEASGDVRYRHNCAYSASALALGSSDRTAARRWTVECGKWAATPVERIGVATRLCLMGDLQEALAQADSVLEDLVKHEPNHDKWKIINEALGIYLRAAEFAKGLPYVPEYVRLVEGPLRGDAGVIKFAWVSAIPIVARGGDRDEAERLARGAAVIFDGLEPALRASQLLQALIYCACGQLWEVAAELVDRYIGSWPVADLAPNLEEMMGAAMAEICSRRGHREQAVAAIMPFLRAEFQFDEEGDYYHGLRLKSAAEVLRVSGKHAEAVKVATVARRLQILWPLRKLLCEELLELLATELPAPAFEQAKAKGEKLTGAEAVCLSREGLGI